MLFRVRFVSTEVHSYETEIEANNFIDAWDLAKDMVEDIPLADFTYEGTHVEPTHVDLLVELEDFFHEV